MQHTRQSSKQEQRPFGLEVWEKRKKKGGGSKGKGTDHPPHQTWHGLTNITLNLTLTLITLTLTLTLFLTLTLSSSDTTNMRVTSSPLLDSTPTTRKWRGQHHTLTHCHCLRKETKRKRVLLVTTQDRDKKEKDKNKRPRIRTQQKGVWLVPSPLHVQ